jgi:hypothetical protein
MPVNEAPARAMAWLGRQGTRATTAIVFVGIAVPPIGAALKPFVTEAIFVLLSIAFLRVDMAALRRHVARPGLVLGATAWTTLAVPVLFGAAGLAAGLDTRLPDLFLALMLQAAASPMMAAPALAALIGLDSTLVLVTLVAGTALVPLTAPLLIHAFVGPVLSLAPAALGAKLLAILAGSALAAFALRRAVGMEAIRRRKAEIDGINVLVLFVFVTAVMENVAAEFAAAPMLTIGLAVFAFLVFFALLGATALLFVRAGHDRALALGLMASQRNMGLMLAAAGGVLPDSVWLYFALCQFPIYLSPQMAEPLANRLRRPRRDSQEF